MNPFLYSLCLLLEFAISCFLEDNLSHPVREQIYETHDAVNYLIIVFPLCDMNLLEYKERGLMTEDKVRDQRSH